MPHHHHLAQTQQVNQSVQQSLDWLTQDPTGRLVGIAIGAVITAIVLLIFFRMFKWAAARWKTFTALAIVLGGAVYGTTYLLDMGLFGLLILGALGMGLFFGLALFLTQGGSRR